MLAHDVGKAVIGQPDQVVELGAADEAFGRRHRVGQDLRVVREQADDAAAFVEVVDAGHAAHALADVGAGAGNFFHRLEEFFRDEVRIGINAHGSFSNVTRGVGGADGCGASIRGRDFAR